MSNLPTRELGRTGLPVTMLGYGAMELRGAPRARDISEAQAETILNAVLDAGINYIDTSIDYGLSEERIGRYIGHRRDEYYLASKCGCLVGAPPAINFGNIRLLNVTHSASSFVQTDDLESFARARSRDCAAGSQTVSIYRAAWARR